MSRRGVSANGEPGVRVQVILPKSLVEQLGAWRGKERPGPAVRRIVAWFFARQKDSA